LSLIFLSTISSTSDTETLRETLVFLGDSVTTERYDGWSHYTEILAKKPRWELLNLINSAFGGFSVRNFHDTPELVQTLIIKYNPKYIVSALGLADLSYVNETKFYEHYKWLLDTIYSDLPDVQFFIVRFSYSQHASEENMEAYLSQIDRIVTEYDLYPPADVYNATKGKTGIYVDGVHPNYSGASLIAETIDAAFTQYLPEENNTTSESSSTSVDSKESVNGSSLFFYPIIGLIVLPIIGILRKYKKKDN
jgi:lysophospholipase L1-like esterase